jgi:hypothetical protein
LTANPATSRTASIYASDIADTGTETTADGDADYTTPATPEEHTAGAYRTTRRRADERASHTASEVTCYAAYQKTEPVATRIR